MSAVSCSTTAAVTSAHAAPSRRSVRAATSSSSSRVAAASARVGIFPTRATATATESLAACGGDGMARGGVTLTSRMRRKRGTTTTTKRSATMNGGGNDGVAPSLSVDTADGEKKKKKPELEPVPNPPLRVAAGLAAAGCAESAYLAFEKLTGGDVTCPLSGCQTALSSSYSTLLGLPLSAFGAAAYGLVAALAWWGAGMAGDEEEAGPKGVVGWGGGYARRAFFFFFFFGNSSSSITLDKSHMKTRCILRVSAAAGASRSQTSVDRPTERLIP